MTCPRVSKPFDEAEQAGEYPPEYVAGIVELAFEMISITPFYGARTRVGIAHGPAAGAVIGTLRAFYCLYGDTVNTSARMCKNAPAGHVYCTEEFAALVVEEPPRVMKRDKGIKEIKGKGPMRLMELCNAEKDVHMSASISGKCSVASINGGCSITEVDYQAIALQTQQAWLKDPVRRIVPPLYKFADEPLEGVFQTMAAAGQRRLLTLGLVLNALATALEWRMGGMSDLLTGHFALAWGVCACILLLLWSHRCSRSACGRLFSAQLVAHLCVASVGGRAIRQTNADWSWTLVFATGICIITAWMGSPSVHSAVALGAAAIVAFFTALAAQPVIAPRATDAALIISLAVGMVLSHDTRHCMKYVFNRHRLRLGCASAAPRLRLGLPSG